MKYGVQDKKRLSCNVTQLMGRELGIELFFVRDFDLSTSNTRKKGNDIDNNFLFSEVT